jgi:HEAT repeat protein
MMSLATRGAGLAVAASLWATMAAAQPLAATKREVVERARIERALALEDAWATSGGRELTKPLQSDRDTTQGAREEQQRAREDEQRAREAEQRERETEQRMREAVQREREREERLYEQGQDALEDARWQVAIDRFTSLVAANVGRTDAALYWKAYALDKLGQKADALAAASELIKQFPKSRWLSDAKALEIQVRQSVGQPVRPETEADEELKLLALQGLQHSDPEQAVPMLEKILQGPQSPRMKERALFVLAQSSSPRARQAMATIARGGNPDLQRKAIQYLGVHGSRENRDLLAEIYASSTDLDIKKRILRSFGVSGDRARVLAAATNESSPEMRTEAVRQLGVMGAHEELGQLYQKESSVEVKRQILQAMFVGGNSTRLIEIANGESNVELRRAAIRALGQMRSQKTGDALVAIYGREKDVDTRKAVIQAFGMQNNAESLVTIARKETDVQLRKEIVARLSTMRSKVALDYLMEILNKE